MRAPIISSIAAVLVSVALLSGSAMTAAADATSTPPSTRVLAEAPVSALPPAPVVVALARFTHAPGASFPNLVVSGPELIAVETGTLSVRMPGDPDDAPQMASLLRRGATPAASPVPAVATPEEGVFEFTLQPNDSLLVPGDTPHEILNRGRESAVYLAAAVTPQPAQASDSMWPPDGSASPLPAGIQVQPLDVGYASGTVAPSGSARITLSRLTIIPGAEIPRHQAGGPELLSVEMGTLDVLPEGGEIEVRSSVSEAAETVRSEESTTPAAPIRVAANGAALIQPGTILTARNAGEDHVAVLRLTILPA